MADETTQTTEVTFTKTTFTDDNLPSINAEFLNNLQDALIAAREKINELEGKTDIPIGGTSGQVLTKKSNADNDIKWADVGKEIPSGGTTGQVLTKNSDTDNDIGWADASGGGVESGSNTSGRYIKFSDGTMICTKSKSLSNISVGTQQGNGYISSEIDLGDFATAFIEKPIVNISLGGTSNNYTGMVAYFRNTSATAIGVMQIFRPSSTSSYTSNVNVIAIGRWK